MIKNYKLYLKCILNNKNYTFVSNSILNNNAISVIITGNLLYYITLHLRFSTLFYSSQLVDIFSYEVATDSRLSFKKSSSSIVVYNFHLLNNNSKFIFFTKTPSTTIGSVSDFLSYKNFCSLFSIAEVYFSANWLEREVSELNGIFFTGKKDIRNLMLQYGDSTTPFQKSFPSIGLKEMYYNPIKDTIIQNPVSLQI